MDFDLIYAASAAFLAALLLKRYLAKQPLLSLPVGGVAVALAFVAMYPWITSFYNTRAFADLQAFDQSRQCIMDTLGAFFSHTSFALGVLFTIQQVFKLFSQSPIGFLASLVLDEIVDALNSFVQGILYYLGMAEATLGTLAAVVGMLPIFTSIGAPLIAAFVPDRRGAAIAAVVAVLPVVAAAPFLLTPPLAPYNACATGFIGHLPAVVEVGSNAPLVWVFNGTAFNSTVAGATTYNQVAAVYGAFESGRVYVPAGNYTAYVVWSFMRFNISSFNIRPSRVTYGSVEAFNTTVYVTNFTTSLAIEGPSFGFVHGWDFASDKPPDWYVDGNYTYAVEYSCYGTTAECSPRSWTFDGMGTVKAVKVVVLAADHVGYDYKTWVANSTKAVEPRLWVKLCWIGEFPGSRCPVYHVPKEAGAEVAVKPTPVYECDNNGTCREVPVKRTFKAVVIFTTEKVEPPVLAGMQYNGYRTYQQVKDLTEMLQATTLTALTGPALSATQFALKYLSGPVDWVLHQLIPYLLALIYAELAVVAGAAGVLALLGAGNALWRWLNLKIIAQMRWDYDPIRGPLRLVRRAATSAARGESPTEPVAPPVATSVTQKVTAETVKRASVGLLALAGAIRLWEMFYYSSPVFWPLYGAQGAALYRHIRSTDLGATRREALAKAAFYTLTPAGNEYARRLDAIVWYIESAAYLRFDIFTALLARHLHEAYRANLELTGDKLLAAELTAWYMRRAAATEAAYYVLASGRGDLSGAKYFYPLLRELAERTGIQEEELARRWMRLYGYDYDALKEALQRLGLPASPQTVVALPLMPSEELAKRLIEMGEYRLAAAFSWTSAVREFSTKYAPLEALARGERWAWERFVSRVYAEEWEPLRAELPRPSEYLAELETLRRLAREGPDEAALARLVEGILPEEAVRRALAGEEGRNIIGAMLRELAGEERNVERLVDLYARSAEPWELVEEAKRLMDMGHSDLAKKLGDAAELAAAARMAEVFSLPIRPDQQTLDKLMALGLTEDQALWVWERYGSYAVEMLRDALVPRMEEEPSKLAESLAETYFDKEAFRRAADELEEILGWRPTEEQIAAVRDLYFSAEGLRPDALAEIAAEHVEKYGWAEVPGHIAHLLEERYGLVELNGNYVALRPDVYEEFKAAVKDVEKYGEARVSDPAAAHALHLAGYSVEPAGSGEWIVKRPGAAEAAEAGREAPVQHGSWAPATEAVETRYREEDVLRWAEEVHRLAAQRGEPIGEEEAMRYAREHGPSAANVWAEEYAERRWGQWAREYVEERGWAALEVLDRYEELEKEAVRLGVDLPREALLQLAEREDGREELLRQAAEAVAKLTGADPDEVAEYLRNHSVQDALREFGARR